MSQRRVTGRERGGQKIKKVCGDWCGRAESAKVSGGYIRNFNRQLRFEKVKWKVWRGTERFNIEKSTELTPTLHNTSFESNRI